MTSILVVDDSVVDRRLICGLLGKESRWTVREAEDGRTALVRMSEVPADVVVTDLQMPGMDGLELVAALRAEYPAVPVIIMTGHGSEELAVQALKQGAASYVPKSQTAEILATTIWEVMGVARANRSHERLIESLTSADVRFFLESNPALIDAVVDLVQRMLVGMGTCDSAARMRVAMALDQALRNALYHGNLEINAEQIEETREALILGKRLNAIEERLSQKPYCQRRISLSVCMTAEEARFTVRDEGPGFDVASVLRQNNVDAVQENGGRGLVLMRTFMDEVTYNDRGNEVTLVKRNECEPEAPTNSPR